MKPKSFLQNVLQMKITQLLNLNKEMNVIYILCYETWDIIQFEQSCMFSALSRSPSLSTYWQAAKLKKTKKFFRLKTSELIHNRINFSRKETFCGYTVCNSSYVKACFNHRVLSNFIDRSFQNKAIFLMGNCTANIFSFPFLSFLLKGLQETRRGMWTSP